MIFPTLSFLVFFLCVWPAAWLPVIAGRHRLHKLVVIAASYVFYAFWSVDLAAVLFGCVLATWGAARCMDRARSERARGAFLTLGTAANLAALASFKYYGWFSQELNAFLATLGLDPLLPLIDIVLPIGISFYTLQGISYLVDLKRGTLSGARSLLDVTFFISFFPHLLAGPIVRAARFLPQLERPPDPERVFVQLGVVLIVWGAFKKAVVANGLAVRLVDKAFFDPLAYGAIDIAVAVYGYAVQIYCDFSAYSDIAIGLAALLGYRLPRNFNQPYRAATLTDFWRRWHMSLSSWLRDYLYIPLGGNRHGKGRTILNIMLTMLLGGLWHGAAWKFVIWGGFHGCLLTVERLFRGAPDAPISRTRSAVGILVTFHAVCLGWILFRADSIAQAGEILRRLGDWSQPVTLLTPATAAMIAFGLLVQFTPADLPRTIDRLYRGMPAWAIGVLAGLALLLIEAIGGDGSAPFIYFRF